VADRVLSQRALNRATLARQLLLDRADLPVEAAIEQLAGLQAQHPNSPYISLWTRLRNLLRDDLTGLIDDRRVVRATLMRSTLHLVTADDYLHLRPALQPALERAYRGFFSEASKRVDFARLAAAAREYTAERPHTFPELRQFLSHLEPDEDPAGLSYAARALVPLVQVPPAGHWGSFGSPAYIAAEVWLGRPLVPAEDGLCRLVMRYLAAWGPATRKDIEAWSGLSRLQATIDRLAPQLRTYRDEQGHVLYDLPDAPRPDPEVRAPPRFLPEYDNLILSHADRTRMLPEQYPKRVILPPSRVLATFLVDGSVAGTWRVERSREAATLLIEPLEPLSPAVQTALTEEGTGLLQSVADDATHHRVQVAG